MGRALAKPLTQSVRKANRPDAIRYFVVACSRMKAAMIERPETKRWVSQGLKPSYEREERRDPGGGGQPVGWVEPLGITVTVH